MDCVRQLGQSLDHAGEPIRQLSAVAWEEAVAGVILDDLQAKAAHFGWCSRSSPSVCARLGKRIGETNERRARGTGELG